ncbi:MAG TPA: hypothetical protein VK956_04495, partial [Verrucomicrobium sp.]|nr:hypothetical protein [Verrucomicrobium sp.]
MEYIAREEATKNRTAEPDPVYIKDVTFVDHGAWGAQFMGDDVVSRFNPALVELGAIMRGTIKFDGCNVAAPSDGDEYLQGVANAAR